MLTNPKSESKVQVKFDDWVFIRIIFSNHLITQTPTTTGIVKKKQYTAIYPKQKVLVYLSKFWNIFGNKFRPKNDPVGSKNDQKLFNQVHPIEVYC